MRRRSASSFAARYLCALTLALAALPACGGSGGAASHAMSDHPLLGAVAPPLDVPMPTSKGKLSLKAHHGKVVIVDFWATWCEPCRSSFPAYQQLAEEFRGKLVVLGVSVDDSPEGIAAFVNETQVKFPIGWDEGQNVAQSYRPTKMPTSFVIDRSGIIRFIHGGFSPGDEAQIREEVRSLL